MRPTCTLTVTVERVLHPKADDGTKFHIIKTDQGVIKGSFGWRPNEGERLKVDGEYVVYNGQRQFKVNSVVPCVPDDPRALLEYVCTNTSGVGPAMTERIWEVKGADWASLKRGEIPRMSDMVYDAFIEQIGVTRARSEQTSAVCFLLALGATQTMADAAWNMWGPATIGKVKSNPYVLTALPGFSFRNVDEKMRHGFGIGDHDERRLRAALLYAMAMATAQGSTVVAWGDVRADTRNLLGFDEGIGATAKALIGEGQMIPFKESGVMAMQGDYESEEAIWEWAVGL